MSLDTRGVQIPNGSKNPDDEQSVLNDIQQLRIHKHLGLSIEHAENLSRWCDCISAKEATQKALTFFNDIPSQKWLLSDE